MIIVIWVFLWPFLYNTQSHWELYCRIEHFRGFLALFYNRWDAFQETLGKVDTERFLVPSVIWQPRGVIQSSFLQVIISTQGFLAKNSYARTHHHPHVFSWCRLWWWLGSWLDQTICFFSKRVRGNDLQKDSRLEGLVQRFGQSSW